MIQIKFTGNIAGPPHTLHEYWQFSRRTIVRREFARTRANSPGFAANSREFANCSPTFFSCEHWRTIGEHSANSREHWRSSREFTRIRAEFAANWRTVRQKIFLFDLFQIFGERSANDRSPRTIITQQTVRRERLFGEQSFAAHEQSFAENF